MSYEGYTEYLCSNGHLSSLDAYFEAARLCTRCNAKIVFAHDVDETNGVGYDDEGNEMPGTIGYPFEENGFDDIWHKDHYGNKYATKLIRYKIPEENRSIFLETRGRDARSY